MNDKEAFDEILYQTGIPLHRSVVDAQYLTLLCAD
jgi:hypothetical protein